MHEISIISIIKFLWSKRNFIVKVTLVFISLGLVVALTSPKEWKSKTILLPESTSTSSINGSLSGVASLAGIELSNRGNENEINPELYPVVGETTPFLIKVGNEKFYSEKVGGEISLYEYLVRYEKKTLLSRLSYFFESVISRVDYPELLIQNRNGNEIRISRGQLEILSRINNRINIYNDKLNGLISVEVKMQEPAAAAKLANFVRDYISEFIIEYQIDAKRRELNFLNEKLKEKKTEFEEKQQKLAIFRDSNQGLSTVRAQNELDGLQLERDLSFNLYNGLAQEFQEADIRLEELKPVFKILEPSVIPVRPSEPRRVMIIFLAAFLGVVTSFVLIIIKESIAFLKNGGK